MLVRVTAIAILAMIWLVSAADAAEPGQFPRTEEQTQDLLTQPNFARGGFYFGFEGLWAISWLEIPSTYVRPPPPAVTNLRPGEVLTRQSGGFDMRVGYRPNRWTASELSGLYIHDFGQRNIQYQAWGMWASQRVYFSNRRLQPYATVGLGFTQLRATGNYLYTRLKFTPIFGVGVELYQTQSIAYTLVGNFYLPVATKESLYFATAGIGMIFY